MAYVMILLFLGLIQLLLDIVEVDHAVLDLGDIRAAVFIGMAESCAHGATSRLNLFFLVRQDLEEEVLKRLLFELGDPILDQLVL